MLSSYDLSSIVRRLDALAPVEDAADGAQRAAVAVILRAPRDGHEAEVLLIRRSERAGDPWSGHMAFPGGRREPSDPSLYHTAMRETMEEVGLDLALTARYIGRLPDVPAVSRSKRVNMTIAAFVFELDEPEPPPLALSEEVAEVIWAPLGPMARREIMTTFEYNHDGQDYVLPGYAIAERVVWGLTFRMLELLFEAIHRE